MPLLIEFPLALFGLLALFIPLAIHLLSKARPRVIEFAHIAFIKVKTSPKLRQFRLTQLFLLALRMLILLLATLIIAQLFWQKSNQQYSSHILLTEDWLDHASENERQRLIDQTQGSELVLLSTKNRTIGASDLAQWSTNNLPTPALNLWSKVATYTAQLPAKTPIAVYTSNRLKQFVGQQIPLPKQIEWHVKTIPVENVEQALASEVKVIYDDASESLLAYLRAAFEVINKHKKLELKIDYANNEEAINESRHLQSNNTTIDLSEVGLAQQHLPVDALKQHKYISLAELNTIKQPDFVLTLAQLLFSSQSQTWWLENTRLSEQQVTQQVKQQTLQNPAMSYSQSPHSQNTIPNQTPLHIWLALLLVAIFILERCLSEWPNSRLNKKLDEELERKLDQEQEE